MRRIEVWMVALMLGAGTAWGLINPSYTPKHVVKGANAILAGQVQTVEGQFKIMAGRIIKGEIEKECTLSLEGCNKDHAARIEGMLAESVNQPIVLFSSGAGDARKGFAHVGGTWLEVKAAGGSLWKVAGTADLGATYAGGTDQLIRMAEYLQKDEGGDVPVSAGVEWLANPIKIGKAAGTVIGMAAMETGKDKDKKIHFFVASPDGDKLYRVTTADFDTKFEDVTKASGLDSKSRSFVWMDVNKDGLADLVTWDGANVSVWIADSSGKLKAGEGEWRVKVDGECNGLAVCSIDGAPCALVSFANSAPILLVAGEKGWKRTALPNMDRAGRQSPCVVGDFDMDGYADVLQAGEQDGAFFSRIC